MAWGWVAAATIGSALIGSDAASSASDAQASASRDAAASTERSSAASVAEQRRQYDIAREDYAPWRAAGGPAVTRLSQLLGLSAGPDSGALNRKFSVADFMDDPITRLSYQSGLDLGTQAIDRMAGARGSRNSGATLKALSRFGTDYTGAKAGESYNRFYGDQERDFNRLAGISGVGQTAARDTAAAGSNAANNIGNIMTAQGNTLGSIYGAQGNARGAAAIAQGNIWGGAAQNIGNWYGRNQMLNQYLNQPSYSYGSSGGNEWDTFNVPGMTYG